MPEPSAPNATDPSAGRTGGVGFVLLAAALWGMFGVVARVALRDGVPPLDIAFWRTLIAFALFAVHHIVRHRVARRGDGPASGTGERRLPHGSLRIRANDLPGIALFALTGIAALYAFLPLAVEAGGATLAAVLLYTAPAWVAILSTVLLGERLTSRTLVALGLTLAGIAGIALAGDGALRPTPAALGWGLAAGLSYASLYLFGKFYFARYAPPVVFLYALPIAALALVPFTAFHRPSTAAAVAILTLGVACTYLAYLAYGAGLARLEPTRAATIATAEPVIAAVLAFAFWDERLSSGAYAASLLVIAGVAITAAAPVPRPSGTRRELSP
ncbi:MAG TPA: EamA family transporter [Gemmatimonadaceae bacterium]|nr:EamA family transporter [Gemmatimonadaceae bacterium]